MFWGLYLIYYVDVDEIVVVNFGIEKGLNVGSKVFILVGNVEVGMMDGIQVKGYVVQKGEIFYSIVKKNGVIVEQFNKLNLDVVVGLILGLVLRILVVVGQQ